MSRFFLPLVALSVVLFFGCNSKAPQAETEAADHDHEEHGHDEHGHEHEHADHEHDHEHGDESKTYAEAVAKIEAARDAIRDGLSADEKEKADAALHDVGHVIEHLPELAKETTLSVEEQGDVKKDADELFDEFSKLDEQIHGGAEITYEAFSEKIDTLVERLKSRVEK